MVALIMYLSYDKNMKIERKKVSIAKKLLMTILNVTGIFVVLLFALLHSMYINPAKYNILENLRGIDKAMIIGAMILAYLVAIIVFPILIIHRSAWNNKHLDVMPIEVFGDCIVVRESSKSRKIYFKDIKEFQGKNDVLEIALNDKATISVGYIKQVKEVAAYLNSLLVNEREKN